MTSKWLDTDSILSGNDQWSRLDLEWGHPVDLDTEDDQRPSPVFDDLDLCKTTFDSSYLVKQVRKGYKRKGSLPSPKNYKEFLQDLNVEEGEYQEFSSGQFLSAISVEEITKRIDEIFKSVAELCSATSTVRVKEPEIQGHKKLPVFVECSISVGDLSFDDTTTEEYEEKCDSDDISMFIDEAFRELNLTMAGIASSITEFPDQPVRESVTTLVKKFSTNPMYWSPRKKRRCNEKFRELAEFWKSKTSGGK